VWPGCFNGGGALWKARKVGFAPRQIIFNGLAKTRAEIGEALAAGTRGLESARRP